jgi:hypothetical protein
MYQKVTFSDSDFIDAFRDHGHDTHFSYEAQEALFNYLEKLEKEEKIGVYMNAVSHRLVVNLGEQFECPFCGAQYILEKDDDAILIVLVSDHYCNHLDTEIFPALNKHDCNEFEVYFNEIET